MNFSSQSLYCERTKPLVYRMTKITCSIVLESVMEGSIGELSDGKLLLQPHTLFLFVFFVLSLNSLCLLLQFSTSPVWVVCWFQSHTRGSFRGVPDSVWQLLLAGCVCWEVIGVDNRTWAFFMQSKYSPSCSLSTTHLTGFGFTYLIPSFLPPPSHSFGSVSLVISLQIHIILLIIQVESFFPLRE